MIRVYRPDVYAESGEKDRTRVASGSRKSKSNVTVFLRQSADASSHVARVSVLVPGASAVSDKATCTSGSNVQGL